MEGVYKNFTYSVTQLGTISNMNGQKLFSINIEEIGTTRLWVASKSLAEKNAIEIIDSLKN